tara:strand:+ start:199 stop:414 length:216 start_codon:yes stop_codon:yes gene_type:complete
MKIILTLLAAASFLGACSNENLNVQLSPATSEADKHTGVIIYSGFSFQLVRVKIDGVEYIANSKGGLVRVQ